MKDKTYKVRWTAEIDMTYGELHDFITGRSLISQPGWDDFALKTRQLYEDINFYIVSIGDYVSQDEEGYYYLDRNGDYIVTHKDDDGYLYARKFR